jgi:sulfate transport system substrate-binding protein
VTPNPFTSGGARWNVMAAYGACASSGKTDRQAQDYLLKLFKNVVSQDKSARDSLQTFNAGRGDVLLAYENEASVAPVARPEAPVPDPALDDPDREPDRGPRRRADTRARRTRSSASCGRRRADGSSPRTATGPSTRPSRRVQPRSSRPPGQFTIDQLGLGGWAKVQKVFFDPDKGVMAGIERKVGGSTG